MFRTWSANLRQLAKRPNVMCKVGGLGMPVWGFRFEEREDVVGYQELAATWRPYVEAAIDAFGIDRCMMESNFPPDGRSGGFIPTWNAHKHILSGCSAEEKAKLFARKPLAFIAWPFPASELHPAAPAATGSSCTAGGAPVVSFLWWSNAAVRLKSII